ncbi:MAG: glycoside hydrolase [Proteobacteria bacterium]|nr:glycoside hydrolase [Pseudomonadota bacterium]
MAKKLSNITSRKAKRVRFDLYAPEGNRVSLAGDFNHWDVNDTPMKSDSKGNWKVSVNLQPGRYEYRFWVDGIWQDDSKAQERVGNPFGSHNCVRIVA